MNKKSIGAILLSAALLVAGTASTFAYFTSKAESDIVSFTTGDVKIRFIPGCEDGWRYLGSTTLNPNNEVNLSDVNNVKNLAPGDIVKKTFRLENNGSLDAKVRLSLDDMIPDYEYNQGWFIDPEAVKVYKINEDGERGPEVQIQLEYDQDVQGTIIGGIRYLKYVVLDASCNEKMDVELYVTLNPLMGNGVNNANFNKKFDLKVIAQATQWNNPGWDEMGK